VQVSQPDCARQGRANRQSPVEVGRSVRAALLPAAPFLIWGAGRQEKHQKEACGRSMMIRWALAYLFIIASRLPGQQRIEGGRMPSPPSLVLIGGEMPIRETKKMIHATVAIAVAIAVLAVCAMLILEFPPS